MQGMKKRYVILLILIFVLICIGLWIYTYQEMTQGMFNHVHNLLLKTAKAAQSEYNVYLDQMCYGMSQGAAEIHIQNLVKTKDGPALQKLMATWKQTRPYVDFWAFTDDQGHLIQVLGTPQIGAKKLSLGGLVDHVLKTNTIIKATEIIDGREAYILGFDTYNPEAIGIELMVQFAVVPIVTVEGEFLGTIVTGNLLNGDLNLVQRVQERYQVINIIFLGQQGITSSNGSGFATASSFFLAPQLYEELKGSGKPLFSQYNYAGLQLDAMIYPIEDFQGKIIGAYLLGIPQDEYALLPLMIKKMGLTSGTIIISFALLLIVFFLQILKLNNDLRDLSNLDQLTGLYNRRFLDDYLLTYHALAQRQQASYSILMVDIDHFKAINDQYGHETGDQVLRRLAQCFKAKLRTSDIAARYGGEEFTLILPLTDQSGASVVAENIRQTVEALSFQDIGINRPITISIGLATYPQFSVDSFQLLHLADKALYLAKRKGRNRVCTPQELED